jgi:hypothetical protein
MSQQPQGRRDLSRLQVLGRRLDVVPRELEPQLRRLVHRLEEELVTVNPLVRGLLQPEQRVRVEVALVVAPALAFENRLRVVLVGRHGRSILRA